MTPGFMMQMMKLPVWLNALYERGAPVSLEQYFTHSVIIQRPTLQTVVNLKLLRRMRKATKPKPLGGGVRVWLTNSLAQCSFRPQNTTTI